MNDHEPDNGKKKRKVGLIIGITLLILIGIPIMLFGACMLFLLLTYL